MFRSQSQVLVLLLMSLITAVPAQARNVPAPSPRSALVEMLSGGENNFRKHLTIEVQKKLDDLLKESTSGTIAPLHALSMVNDGSRKFDAFDYGPILFALNDAANNQRLEIHLDADEAHGDVDDMDVSLHSFHGGVEEEMAMDWHFRVSLKLQEGVWRLDTITVIARVPVGDPRIFDKAWWNTRNMNTAALTRLPADGQQVAEPDTPKMTVFRAVRIITLAEDQYAQKHPDVGYTCGIADLVNIGKGLDDGEPYTFLDPQFAGGLYRGYRFSLTGCQGKPAKAFQIAAVPLDGKGKAYCSDDRHNLRASDDGQASTCLTEGKIARR